MNPDQKSHASGTIQVQSWEGEPYDEPLMGPSLVRANVNEQFSGDIVGSGAAEFLQIVGKNGFTSFVGVERVTGTIAGRNGSFVLQDTGEVHGSEVSGSWFVVAGSGTDQLEGLRGEGSFEAVLGQNAKYTLDFWFE